MFSLLYSATMWEKIFFFKQKCSNHHVISEAMVLSKTPDIMSFMVK